MPKKELTPEQLKKEQEKKKGKGGRRPTPKFALIFDGSNIEDRVFASNEEMLNFINTHVEGGADSIDDGRCSLNDGRQCVFVFGKKVTPKVTTTIKV